MEDNNLYPLNTQWCLWYHSIEDTTWNKKSYKYLCDINDLYDLNMVNSIIKSHHLQNRMFFLMREGIFPTWEDPDNRNGSCLSFKISGYQLLTNWTFIVERVLTEDILKDKDKYNETPEKIICGEINNKKVHCFSLNKEIISPIGWIEENEDDIKLIDFRTINIQKK